MKNHLILTLSLFLLSSCTLFSPIKTEPVTTYVLNTVPQSVPKKATRRIALLVTPTESNAIYNTPEMAYTTRPYQIAYFAKNRWAETPARMLQPLIVQALQNTHYFRIVSGTASIGRYHFILNTQLIQLQQTFFSHLSFVRLTLRAQLINASNGQVLATKQFSVEEFASRTPYGGVKAANRATAKVLKQLAGFCLQKI